MKKAKKQLSVTHSHRLGCVETTGGLVCETKSVITTAEEREGLRCGAHKCVRGWEEMAIYKLGPCSADPGNRALSPPKACGGTPSQQGLRWASPTPKEHPSLSEPRCPTSAASCSLSLGPPGLSGLALLD